MLTPETFDEPLITAEEAMAFLNVKRTAFYALLREGYLPAVKLGKLWRFRKSTLLDWINEQEKSNQWRRI